MRTRDRSFEICGGLRTNLRRRLKRLIGDVVEAPKDQGRIIATAVIPVARARYKISAVRDGDWIRFPVEGLAAFEKIDGELMDQTVTSGQIDAANVAIADRYEVQLIDIADSVRSTGIPASVC